MASNLEEKVNKVLGKLQLNLNVKPKQLLCLEKLLNREDVFVVFPTGYGKSLIYQLLPYLMFDENETESVNERTCRDFSIVIVVSPLVSLMKDQVAHMSSSVPCAYLGESQSAGIFSHFLLYY